MKNLDSIFRSRGIILPAKVHIVKPMIFPVVMYGYESWTIRKAELRRTDSFELWCWRKLLRVLWTTKRSNQSILKEINPEYSLKELMLKLQYFGHLMWRANSLEKTLMLGKIEGRQEEKGMTEDEMVGWQHQLSVHEFEKALGDGEGQGSLACFSPWGRRVRHNWATEQQQIARSYKSTVLSPAPHRYFCEKIPCSTAYLNVALSFLAKIFALITSTAVLILLHCIPFPHQKI